LVTIGLELTPGSCSQTYIPTYIPTLAKHNLPSPSVGEVIINVQQTQCWTNLLVHVVCNWQRFSSFFASLQHRTVTLHTNNNNMLNIVTLIGNTSYMCHLLHKLCLIKMKEMKTSYSYL